MYLHKLKGNIMKLWYARLRYNFIKWSIKHDKLSDILAIAIFVAITLGTYVLTK